MTQPADKSHQTPVRDEKRQSRYEPAQSRRVTRGKCDACLRLFGTLLEVELGLVEFQICGRCRGLLGALIQTRRDA